MSFVNTLKRLEREKLIHPPSWLLDNSMYCTQMGSVAYGVANNDSDIDIYGFCVPPLKLTFPHLAGEIPGFGTQLKRFNEWQQHHIKDLSSEKEYDISIYSIVKYFQLCMENNPNMIDSLFTPRRCIVHSTAIAEILLERRKIFLHKGSWYKFKGYAYSQMAKIKHKHNHSNPKRAESIATFGYDVKFLYHTVRLLTEVEQIMIEGDLDLERNREQLKSIRRGDWTLDYAQRYFEEREKYLEEVYTTSKLQHSPDEQAIKNLLLVCLEHHYGSLSKIIQTDPKQDLLNDLERLLSRYR